MLGLIDIQAPFVLGRSWRGMRMFRPKTHILNLAAQALRWTAAPDVAS